MSEKVNQVKLQIAAIMRAAVSDVSIGTTLTISYNLNHSAIIRKILDLGLTRISECSFMVQRGWRIIDHPDSTLVIDHIGQIKIRIIYDDSHNPVKNHQIFFS